jgi:hypothetical protein
MKKCHHCGTLWQGFRGQPRAREVCESCGKYLHACVNCHYLDRRVTSACTLKDTAYVGSRVALNYCEEFRMLDSSLRAREEKVLSARQAWEDLFRR